MKFETLCTTKSDKAYFALDFLRKAYEEGRLNEIENIEYVFDCLDISQDLEYAQQRLELYHIDY